MTKLPPQRIITVKEYHRLKAVEVELNELNDEMYLRGQRLVELQTQLDLYKGKFDKAFNLLQALADAQNGPPLERYRQEWELIMRISYEFLSNHQPKDGTTKFHCTKKEAGECECTGHCEEDTKQGEGGCDECGGEKRVPDYITIGDGGVTVEHKTTKPCPSCNQTKTQDNGED